MTRISAVALWFLLSAGVASAHDWYDSECCSGQDCAPVPDGYLTYYPDWSVDVPKWGHVSDGRLRWSKDSRDHVCQTTGKLYCVYRKPPGT